MLRSLAAADLASPEGRIHHVSYGPDHQLHVIDIWDTPESFRAFGEKLFPILARLEIEIGEPIVMPVHNVIRG